MLDYRVVVEILITNIEGVERCERVEKGCQTKRVCAASQSVLPGVPRGKALHEALQRR